MNLRVREVTDQEWVPGRPAVMVVEARSAFETQEEARLDLSVAFRVERVDRGTIVQTEISIGCTGAHFQVSAEETSFSSWSASPSFQVSYETTAKTKAALKGPLRFSPVAGEIAIDRGASATFDGIEQTLGFVRVSSSTLEWSLDSHHGAKAIRDYLMGNLDIWAKFLTKPRLRLRAVSKPRDRRFFDHHNRPLGELASLALFLKLAALKVKLPTTTPIIHEVSLCETLEESKTTPIGVRDGDR